MTNCFPIRISSQYGFLSFIQVHKIHCILSHPSLEKRLYIDGSANQGDVWKDMRRVIMSVVKDFRGCQQ